MSIFEADDSGSGHFGQRVPCVSLIVLLAMNGNATSALQLSGLRVGLLGARLRDLDENA